MKEVLAIKETCLYLLDLEMAKAFYHGLLGFEIISYQRQKHIFFRVGSSVLLCFDPKNSKDQKTPPPHFASGNQHFAFEVSPDDYMLCKEKIKQMGVLIIDEIVWKNGQESFYFNDPEGNVLEIIPRGIWGD